MTKDAAAYQKDIIRERISQIIADYLYDEDESYAYISLYFEKSNGENQYKVLPFGTPSEETPDLYRDYPAGYTPDSAFQSMLDTPLRRVVWETIDGREWKPDISSNA